MPLRSFTTFSKSNQRTIFLLIASHLLWGCAALGLWSAGQLLEASLPWWSVAFVALQLYFASQLLLPALLLHPEDRSRGFYLFWGLTLALSIWLINQLTSDSFWAPLLIVIKSSLLLMVATITGAAMARYVNRLWEIIPVCIVMTLADFSSWLYGPTAGFTRQIQQYYLAPEGPPPLIDMVLVKLAFPGPAGLAPVFGISDWIMVVFFAIVANRYEVNDNLVGLPGEKLARQGLFIPALPVIALIMLLWYAGRYLLRKSHADITDYRNPDS
jgi:hypothetical protein